MRADPVAARRFIFAGSGALMLGIALSATDHAGVGSIVSVLAMAVLIGGIHTFGRSGPEGDAP